MLSSAPGVSSVGPRRRSPWPDAWWPSEQIFVLSFWGCGLVGGGVAALLTRQHEVHAVVFAALCVWFVAGVLRMALLFGVGAYSKVERATLSDPRWPHALRRGPRGVGGWDRWRRHEVHGIRAILAVLAPEQVVVAAVVVHKPRRWARRGVIARVASRDIAIEASAHSDRPAGRSCVRLAGWTPWDGDLTREGDAWRGDTESVAADAVRRDGVVEWCALHWASVVSTRHAVRVPPAEVAWDAADADLAARCGLVASPVVAEPASLVVPVPESVPASVPEDVPAAAQRPAAGVTVPSVSDVPDVRAVPDSMRASVVEESNALGRHPQDAVTMSAILAGARGGIVSAPGGILPVPMVRHPAEHAVNKPVRRRRSRSRRDGSSPR